MATDLWARLQTDFADTLAFERELGSGGMSRVFVAEERALGRRIVVKVLSPDALGGLSAERFAREVIVSARLQHPNIVPVLTAGVVGGLPYYTMPYVEGQSLRARLDALGLPSAMPVAVAIGVLRDVARALAYAHSRGVVHRDIKPENVLLTEDTAVVADFGIAKALAASRPERHIWDESSTGRSHALTVAGTFTGTPAYIAPEQAASDPEADHRVDLYAWGVLAYEVLAGTHPYAHARSAHALIKAHMVEEPLPLESVRVGLRSSLAALVMRCLAKDPAERPASARDISDALSTLGADAGRGDPMPRHLAASGEPIEKSVGVIPFENLGAGEDAEYFSDGITEDIINTLAHVPGLRVASRTSSFGFKGKASSIAEVGAALSVAAILEGSVRRHGNRLRITARLVNAADGFQLWSERFDRELEDVFAIQDEVSRAIAEQLAVRLAKSVSGSRPLTVNAEAYDLYLRGRYFWSRRGAHLRTAIEYFEQASSLDPQFAGPCAGLTHCHVLLSAYGFSRSSESAEPARHAAYRALALDETSADSHYAVGLYEAHFRWDLDAAERHLREADQLNPSWAFPSAHLSHLLVSRGKVDDAYTCADRACAIDPVSPLVNSLAALTFVAGRVADRARRFAERAVELDESFAFSQFCLGLSRQLDERLDDATTAYERAVGLSGRSPLILSRLGALYALCGRTGDAQQVVSELEARGCDPHFAAFVLWDLGDEARGLEGFDRAVSARASNLHAVATLAIGRDLVADRRWQDLLRRHGLSDVADGHEALASSVRHAMHRASGLLSP